MKKIRWTWCLLLLLPCALPPGPERPVVQEHNGPVRFTVEDERQIRDHYRQFRFAPELAEAPEVTAELEDKIARSAQLPPGRALFALPEELERALSPLPPGYARFRAGGDVLLMDVRTEEVVDWVLFIFD